MHLSQADEVNCMVSHTSLGRKKNYLQFIINLWMLVKINFIHLIIFNV